MKIVNSLLTRMGLVSAQHLRDHLDYGPSVAKRLDEHRELVEAIASKTNLFQYEYWHAEHLAMQDDYLMRIFHVVHGRWPVCLHNDRSRSDLVRPRPSILRPCRLPDYIEG